MSSDKKSPNVADGAVKEIGVLPPVGSHEEVKELKRTAGPLQLLDLPLDVLQTIIKVVTNTNDLTSLALTHSVLHRLVIPHIYSRFDIVWPDGGPAVESRAGVDALTYGLATLVMSQDVFGSNHSTTLSTCDQCGSLNFCQHRAIAEQPKKTRRGNDFARYTRKFSLGNGPEDWVKEYMITKECGKMLGTLVALAVGRMRNLESFTWDMPTGVLRDVWLALASLNGRDDGEDCHLDRVWVRWHDNQDTLTASPAPRSGNATMDLPRLLNAAGHPTFQIPHYPRVEFPTFSVLPALRSLSVLDIDEPSYLEEMSVLIERSANKLQEIRVGIAHHAQGRAWARPQEDRTVVPPLPTQHADQVSRKGGILGILLGRFCPIFGDGSSADHNLVGEKTSSTFTSAPVEGTTNEKPADRTDIHNPAIIDQLGALLSDQHLDTEPLTDTNNAPINENWHDTMHLNSPTLSKIDSVSHQKSPEETRKRLVLDTLELERVSLSVQVLSQAFEWSRLRSLTILGCKDHESLWRMLRREFAPPSQRMSSFYQHASNSTVLGLENMSGMSPMASVPSTEYRLCITRLHTDAVSSAFLAFLKETLAPDTLEYLFLQQSPGYKSIVTVDQLYKFGVRRHRSSLKKLLIDSDIRAPDGSPDLNSSWRKWAISRELITCITSGRMILRELSISIEHKDWHYFLQRLPSASTLRSLHIKHIVDYNHGRIETRNRIDLHNRIDVREAAHQILDIVVLRPELELCYLGIENKCYEVVECVNDRILPSAPRDSPITPSHHMEDDEVSDDQDDVGQTTSDSTSDDPDLVSDNDEMHDTEDESQQERLRTGLRLREILFYDDKISIFKARHGRL